MNRIYPYKNRVINYDNPVYIYRNLNSKALSYSIRQKGLVVAHTDAVAIRDAEFIVSEKGKARVQKEKKKNVHAFIKGLIAQNGVMGTDAVRAEETGKQLPAKVKYNPYLDLGFYCDNLTSKPFEIVSAVGVIINKYGVSASYTN